MMNRICGLFAGTMLALVCGGVVGCSDRVEFKWNNSRGTPSIAGFVDDSLVVAYDCREWLETTETWNGSYSESYGCGNDRMCVYNYRVQEDGPRWCDSIETESGSYHWHQLTDSIVWSGSPWDGAGSFIKLWKIGEKPVKYELNVKKEGCKRSFIPNSYKQWLDGKFIGKNGESFDYDGEDCQYVVLDTVKKTLTYKRFDEDLKWVEKCDDVRAWGEDVYCLQTIPNADQIGHLLVNGVDQGMLKINAAIGPFWGNMLELGNNLCELSDEGILKCLSVRWLGGTEKAKFVDENGNTVYLGE